MNDNIKNTRYNVIILSKDLRNNYNFRYNVFDRASIRSLLQTNSKYELKIWMDLCGLKCIGYYVTNLDINKFTYTIKLG